MEKRAILPRKIRFGRPCDNRLYIKIVIGKLKSLARLAQFKSKIPLQGYD